MTSFYLFSDYDVIPPMTLHPYDVTILFLDYDVIIFDEPRSTFTFTRRFSYITSILIYARKAS